MGSLFVEKLINATAWYTGSESKVCFHTLYNFPTATYLIYLYVGLHDDSESFLLLFTLFGRTSESVCPLGPIESNGMPDRSCQPNDQMEAFLARLESHDPGSEESDAG